MAADSEENLERPFRWADDEVSEFNETSNHSSTNTSPCKIEKEEGNIEQQKIDKTRGTLKRRFSYTCTNSRNSSPCNRSSGGSSEDNLLHGGRFLEKRTRCHSNASLTCSIETDPVILARRQKQIDYGKNTAAYDNYMDTVPRSKRTREHPHTPDKYRKYSRRAFDGLIKIWRKQLHVYDPPSLHKSTDTDSDSD